MELAVTAAAGNFLYTQIPASSIQKTVDGLFPYFSRFPSADIPPFGRWHRFREGHDLLIDVPQTFTEHGVRDGVRHSGHIILTDFPTKDGIPIPGLSGNGLGELLVEHGIPRGWLNISVFDGAIGCLAWGEGATDVAAAFSGTLDMDAATFFDTFGEGTVEVLLGMATTNPILAAGGMTNLLAGIVSTWETYTIDVSPLDFFGGALGASVLGAVLTFCLNHQKSLDERARLSLCNCLRSAAVGGLFTVYTPFGFGALLGFACHQLGCTLAQHNAKEQQLVFSVDQHQLDQFLKTVAEGDPAFWDLWQDMNAQTTLLDHPSLLADDVDLFPSEARSLLDHQPLNLNADPTFLDSNLHSPLSTESRTNLDSSPTIMGQDKLEQSET